MPIFIGFSRLLGTGKATRAAQKLRSYTVRTILLNFASAAPRRLRIVSTVTILQQAIRRFCRCCPRANTERQAQRVGKGQQACRESHRPSPAKQLSNGGAFSLLTQASKLAQY